ncbi:trypsin-like peptidase domain-containing protein [Streptomyces griseus]|uniref:trypsin-like peptidase domain-containing protein n=1 Tax=Streptomyces griseus TaxID=1911 RepID=UPI001F1B22B3|nr:trypsin-like peptidase domain-containing protein [Streptomyces griseus]
MAEGAARDRFRSVDETAGEHAGGRRGTRALLPGEPCPSVRRDQLPWDALDTALVRVHDLSGRPRGLGFVADHHGTVITAHETVDGPARLLLHTARDRHCLATAADVTPLPELGLALVRSEGLGVAPLPVSARDRIETGTYVRLAAGCWREARVLGATSATYTATDRFHLIADALELAIGTAGRDALRPGGGAAGGPVLDAATGAVLGVLGTALQSDGRDYGLALPLNRAASGTVTGGPLADLLARNAATVPAYGADLNLAGILELTATSVAQDGPRTGMEGTVGVAEPVERTELIREFADFTRSRYAVLGLVGPPGSGRTTELAALAARRHRGPESAPTLWLRGADLKDGDESLADAAHRALNRAARIVAASSPASPPGLGDITPERLAGSARAADRPLLLLLDGPEEMPPLPAHRLGTWTRGTVRWLGESGARLVVACGEEYWEESQFPREVLYRGEGLSEGDAFEAPGDRRGALVAPGDRRGALVAPGDRRGALVAPGDPSAPPASDDEAGRAEGRSEEAAPGDGTGRCGGGDNSPPRLPPCVRLGDLREPEAALARARYRIPDGSLHAPDARHPLTLRLLAELRAALPDAPFTPLDRDEVFAAYLDLMCLRIAVRLAADTGLRGTAVRRLAAKVGGQIHEAARRSLGPGQGELNRESFEAVFPWGPAPARLGGGTGWASAVLTEGLLVPAGSGYRFAHEELADWIQGTHLDLDEALHALVHRRRDPDGTEHPLPVPHHRIGPVVQSLLLLARRHGARDLASRLADLLHALDADPHSWWAARLLSRTLLRVPDATPYTGVLRLLADRVVAWRQSGRTVPEEFGPAFWSDLRLPQDRRFDLLRRLVLADPAPQDTDTPRYLDAAARFLAADATAVQPYLTRWFDDERPLPATPHATVATAAQALLHTHRHRALDDLTEALAQATHRRADELLTVLTEEEPSAICRAVDRWVRDERPDRRAAAVAYGLCAAAHVRADADRDLLRRAALTLVARPADCTLHGGALALLVQDPYTRDGHLPRALERFAAGDPQFPPSALAAALHTHSEPVLKAFLARLCRGSDTGETLRTLADATTAALARRVAVVIREVVDERPEAADHLAAYVDRRLNLDHEPTTRSVLHPLVTGLLDEALLDGDLREGCDSESTRAALAAVLAAPGTSVSRPLRHELRDFLLARENAPAVLDAVLDTAVRHGGDDLRDLVHRVGLRLVRTPDGATRFDRALVDLSRAVPGFAAQVTGWLTTAPADWAAVVGPSTRRTIENLAGPRVPA